MTRKNLQSFSWAVLSIAVLAADYASGPTIQFPIAFALPVLLAAWYSSRSLSVSLAILLPLARIAFHHYWEDPQFEMTEVINLAIRIIVLTGMAYIVSHTARLSTEIKVLKGLLPVCSSCKKIRTEDGSWKQMEVYISERSEAEFTHGLCPECATRLYGDFAKKKS